jgi:hypothetical protein
VPYDFAENEDELEPQAASARGGGPPRKLTGNRRTRSAVSSQEAARAHSHVSHFPALSHLRGIAPRGLRRRDSFPAFRKALTN